MERALKDSMDEAKGIAITQAIANSIITGSDTIFNTTVLSNIRDIFGGEYGSPAKAISEVPADLLMQSIPTIFGTIARSVDTTRRKTYSEKLGGRTLKSGLTKIPFASKLLEPNLDIWGREIKQDGLVNNLLNPGRFRKIDDNVVTQKVEELYKKTGDTRVIPKVAPYSFTDNGKTIRLTDKEVTKMQRSMGQKNMESIARLIQNGTFSEATVKRVIDFNYNQAKRQILNDRKKNKAPN